MAEPKTLSFISVHSFLFSAYSMNITIYNKYTIYIHIYFFCRPAHVLRTVLHFLRVAILAVWTNGSHAFCASLGCLKCSMLCACCRVCLSQWGHRIQLNKYHETLSIVTIQFCSLAHILFAWLFGYEYSVEHSLAEQFQSCCMRSTASPPLHIYLQ